MNLSGNPLTYADCYEIGRLRAENRSITYDDAGLGCFTTDIYPAGTFNGNFLNLLKTDHDLNGDGQLNPVEAAQIKGVSVTAERLLNSVEGVQNLTNLESLNLGTQNLTSAPDLSSLVNLEQLYLDNNYLSALPNLEGMASLRVLIADRNELTELPDLSSLGALEYLDVSNNQIGGEPVLPINISTLYVNNNQITGLASLADNMELRYMNASNNLLTQLPVFNQYLLLEELDVTGNSLTNGICDVVSDFKYHDVELSIDPQANNTTLSCDMVWWFPGINAREGDYTLDLVNYHPLRPVDNTVTLTFYNEAGVVVTTDEVPLAKGAAAQVAIPRGEVSAVKAEGTAGVTAVLSFAGDDNQDFAFSGGSARLENAFTPHIARDTASFTTVIHAADFTGAEAELSLETFQKDPDLTDAADHVLNYNMAGNGSVSVNLETDFGSEVVQNSSLARIEGDKHQALPDV